MKRHRIVLVVLNTHSMGRRAEKKPCCLHRSTAEGRTNLPGTMGWSV
jgi:hypothetical protein